MKCVNVDLDCLGIEAESMLGGNFMWRKCFENMNNNGDGHFL